MVELISPKTGFSLVEVLLTASIFLLIVTSLTGALLFGGEIQTVAGSKNRAALVVEEGMEAVRNIRDEKFSNLIDGNYGLADGTAWSLSGTEDIVGIFTRQLAIASLRSDTKSITSTVNWQQTLQRPGTITVETRLTNWIASTTGNWTSPLKGATSDVAGNQDGLKIQTEGDYIFMVRDGGAPDFLIINVSNPLSPLISGSLDLPGIPTNIAVSGAYAYVSSQNDTQELQIIDISNPSAPLQVGSFDAAGTANANGVAVKDNAVVLVRNAGAAEEFILINADNKVSPALFSGLQLGDDVFEVVIIGNYAYAASRYDSQELMVIDITNPATPSQIASFNLMGNSNGISITGTSTLIALGRKNGDCAIFDVTTPSAPILASTLALGGTVNDLALGNADTYLFAATADGTKEFQVINAEVFSVPTVVGIFNLAGNTPLNGVAYNQLLDRAFAAGSKDTEEFIIFAPQ